MLRSTSTLVFAFVIALSASAQSPAIEWQRCLGTPITVQNQNTWPYDMAQTLDGGYIMLAEISGNGGDITGWHPGVDDFGNNTRDLWVVKLSSAGALEWQHALGGSDQEHGLSVMQCADGTFIACGLTFSTDGDVVGLHGTDATDLWMLKLSADGELLWQRPLGGDNAEYFLFFGEAVPWTRLAAVTPAGGCVHATAAYSLEPENGDLAGHHGLTDMWVVQVDPDGEVEWQRCIGGSNHDELYSLSVGVVGNIFVAGATTSEDGDVVGHHGMADMFVAKLSPNGELEWARALGGTQEEGAYDLRSTSDGGCIVAGYTSSSDGDVTEQSGPFDIWVVKLNALGVIEWQRSLGGSYSEMVPKVRVAAGGGYYVCTNTISHDGDVSDHHNQPDDWISDIWVVRLDEEGGTLWQRCLGGTGEDVPQGFVELPGGGCTILGMSNSNDGDVQGNNGGWDGWIVELASNGDLLWQRCLGSTTDYDHPLGLTRTMDGGYVHWACVMNGDGDVDPEQFHGRADAWVVKLEGDTHTGIEETRAPAFTIAPVPATHTVRITPDPSMGASHVTIHDAAGRTVHNGPVLGGSLVLDVQHWARGLYAVTLQDARGSSTQRLVLE